MRRIAARPWVFAFLVGSLWVSVPDQNAAPINAADAPGDDARVKREREARLRAMHEEVETVAVKSQSETEWMEARVHGDRPRSTPGHFVICREAIEWRNRVQS